VKIIKGVIIFSINIHLFNATLLKRIGLSVHFMSSLLSQELSTLMEPEEANLQRTSRGSNPNLVYDRKGSCEAIVEEEIIGSSSRVNDGTTSFNKHSDIGVTTVSTGIRQKRELGGAALDGVSAYIP
jgi:hypothetical protein